MFVAASDVTKSYGTGVVTHVLCGVSLRLEPRRIGVILGPSGSGKSTLMNIIGGITMLMITHHRRGDSRSSGTNR